jgi:hypothetical protein
MILGAGGAADDCIGGANCYDAIFKGNYVRAGNGNAFNMDYTVGYGFSCLVTQNCFEANVEGSVIKSAISTMTDTRLVISFNILRDNGESGKLVVAMSLSKNAYTMILGNYVYDTRGTPYQKGIILTVGCDHSNVLFNICVNCAGTWEHGITISYSATTGSNYVKVAFNTCHVCHGGINLRDYCTNCQVVFNDVMDNVTHSIEDTSASTTNLVKWNLGYATEGFGTGTIPSGSTQVDITHGLAITPVASNIIITVTNSPTVDFGHIYIDTLGASTFRVHCRTDPSTSGLTFGWRVP